MIDSTTRTVRLTRQETLSCEEALRERIASWIRFAIGVIASGLVVLEYFLGHSPLNLACIRLGSIAALVLYSSYFLFGYAKTGLSRGWMFALALCDVTVVSYLLWSYSVGSSHGLTAALLFATYGIAIGLTALHHDPWLGIFAGVVAAVESSVLHLVGAEAYTYGMGPYLLRIGIIVGMAAVSSCISLRNRLSFGDMIGSQLRYADLVDRVPEMLFSLDKAGTFLWCNAGSANILGVSPEALAHRSISEFVSNPPAFDAGQEMVKATLEVRDIEGNRKFVDYALRRTQREDGTEAYEGIMSDTTDREIAIAQREEMSSRLFMYQKMESLGTLASGMAHDFNNIMQTITDIVGFVQKESKEPETRKRMDLMSETLVDARFLVSELLALGRKQPLTYTSLNLFTFFGNVIPFFREQLGERYQIVLKMSEEHLLIQGDADYFKRIFQNLVGNARDAMGDGGVITIECSTVREKGKPNTVVIRFSDTGPGIPQDLTERVFDPFFTTKKPGKGTGLGLALVRHIVTLHNGRVFVERSGSTGTTFRIEVPEAAREDLDVDTKQIMLNRLSTTVLLLDDDVKIRDILRIFVRGLGYPICEASNRSEAVEALMRHAKECDVVIMDWKLGGDDPHRVIADLRAINPHLVVIVVSGYAPRPKSIEAMKIHKWFTKPYERNMLDLEIQRGLYRLRKPTHHTPVQAT